MPEFLSESAGIDEMKRYIADDPRFICPWAKEALEAGKITFAEYPETGDDDTRHQAVLAAIQDFGKRDSDAVVFTRPPAKNHSDGFKRTWEFYTDLRTACDNFDRPNAVPTFARVAFEAAADTYIKSRDWDDYMKNGAPEMAGEFLYLISQCDQYDDQHPLYAPVFCHIITRQRDVIGARNADFKEAGVNLEQVGGLNVSVGDTTQSKWFELERKLRDRGVVPYRQGLPYYLPDDPTMDHEVVQKLTGVVREMAGGNLSQAGTDPRQLAIRIFGEAWKERTETELALLLETHGQLERALGKYLL